MDAVNSQLITYLKLGAEPSTCACTTMYYYYYYDDDDDAYYDHYDSYHFQYFIIRI